MTDKLEMHNVDLSGFIKALDACKGNVYLKTKEGDCFNLKSRFSQLIGLTSLIRGGIVAEATLVCENQEDESILFRYDLFRELPQDRH